MSGPRQESDKLLESHIMRGKWWLGTIGLRHHPEVMTTPGTPKRAMFLQSIEAPETVSLLRDSSLFNFETLYFVLSLCSVFVESDSMAMEKVAQHRPQEVLNLKGNTQSPHTKT